MSADETFLLASCIRVQAKNPAAT